MKPYDPFNWYWRVAGDASLVYSSASDDYVASDDATFQEWKADGTLPTNIASEAELGNVLSSYHLRPNPAGLLDSYKSAQATEIVGRPDFKPTFYALQQIAALKGETEPTVEDAVEWIKENTL